MFSSKQGKVLIAVLVLVVLVSIIAILASNPRHALAQVPPGLDERPAPAQPPSQPPMGDMNMMRRPMMGLGGMSIAANEKYVYVVMGGTIYQFTADTLKKVKETTISPAVPATPGGMMSPMSPNNSQRAPSQMGTPSQNP